MRVGFSTQCGKTRLGKLSNPCLQSDFKPVRGSLSKRSSFWLMERATLFPGTKAMLNPSKSDCITILSAASELADDSMLPLDPSRLGLSRNGMLTAAAFLTERACFRRYQEGDGHYAVGALSLQGRLRLEQLCNG
jgi:hypothetical protein